MRTEIKGGSLNAVQADWQFPLGDNVGRLIITGPDKVNSEDMNTLIELANIFRDAMLRLEERK